MKSLPILRYLLYHQYFNLHDFYFKSIYFKIDMRKTLKEREVNLINEVAKFSAKSAKSKH
jgi:hypothetical protein